MTKDIQTSPNFLRVSLAAAMALGLRPGIFYRGARLGCLNLLLTYRENCQANCSYCGLSRSRENPDNNQSFIRVEWPCFPLEEIVERTRRCHEIERVCISMITHQRAFNDTIYLTRLLARETRLPVSVLANPTTMEEGAMEDLLEAGADMVSVAIDAATPALFEQHRGQGVNGPHKWDNYWSSLSEAALVFGKDKAGCHLIAGLGETEQQMAQAIQRVRDLGARTHLFSFYPEEGSLLEKAAACPASQFRRIQLARFLVDNDMARASGMEFDELGRITGFGLSGAALDGLVDSGMPFMTSGCPGKRTKCACNRPYGDGPPGDIRSYPFKPDQKDVQLFKKQLATYREVADISSKV